MNMKGYEQLMLQNQLCFPLYACARQIVNRYPPYLKPLGLTYTQYIVMMVLWEKDGITVGEIGKKLFLDNGTLTPLLKKLETQGFLKRRRSKEDGRVITVKLTKEGKELRELAQGVPAQVCRCVCLSQDELESIYGILYKMLDDFANDERWVGDECEAE